MEPAAPATPAPALLDFTPDRMAVRFAGVAEGVKIPSAEVIAALERGRVRITDAVRARLAEHTNPEGHFTAGPGTVLAAGTPAVDDVPAQLRVYHQQAQAEGLESLDPHSRSGLAIVAKGQTVADAIAYAKGTDGVDVLGRPIQRKRAATAKVALGRNVALEADGKTIAAQESGCLHVEGLRLWVEPRLAIPGDVDFSTGNIHFDGDIVIGGTVLDLFSVWTSGDLYVHGAVEAARVEAGHDLTVDGGIMGKEKGKCQSGGNVRAKYITNAELAAQAEVIVRKEIVNSHIVCGGSLTVESGMLVGGRTTVRGSVSCSTLGSDAEVRTLVEVAVDLALRETAPKAMAAVHAKQHQAQVFRQEAGAIRTNTTDARSLAADKLGEAMVLDMEIDADLALLRQQLAAADALPGEVLVKETIHAGVTVRCGTLQAPIATTMAGPVRISIREMHGGPALVAINQLTASVIRLPHQVRVVDELEPLRHFLAKNTPPKPGA